MKLSPVTARLGLGFVMFASLPVLAAREQAALIPLRVCVFNSSRISFATIERAECEAGRVLRDLGIEVFWLNCPQEMSQEACLRRCSEVSFPLHLGSVGAEDSSFTGRMT